MSTREYVVGLFVACSCLLVVGPGGPTAQASADEGVMATAMALVVHAYTPEGGHSSPGSIQIVWHCTARNRTGAIGFGNSEGMGQAMRYAVADCERWASDESGADAGCFIVGCHFTRAFASPGPGEGSPE